MGAKETTPLLPQGSSDDEEGKALSIENGTTTLAASKLLSRIFLLLQAGFLLFYIFGTTYPDTDYKVKEYIAFRDIMAMLLLGFGYLMTFLNHYGLGAVGLTLLSTAYGMLVNIPIEFAVRYMYNGGGGGGDNDEDTTKWPLPLGLSTLIDAEFFAATLLISFGALIGRVSPVQLMIVLLCEAVFYAINKVVLVLGVVGAEDVGGSMTIHMFGAIFGLAVSFALGAPSAVRGKPEADKVSDVLCLIGTTILWVFWPSFVGATETQVLENESRCVTNTVLALLASTASSFCASYILTKEKFDPVHVANSTLAGGVAIGTGARLNIGPGNAIVLGLVVGAASVAGYVYSTPYLQSKWGICDTCGVGNLHGIPSVIGALFGIAFVAMDSDAEFLQFGVVSQMMRQLVGIMVTLAVGGISGYTTGRLVKAADCVEASCYSDAIWWHAEYFEDHMD